MLQYVAEIIRTLDPMLSDIFERLPYLTSGPMGNLTLPFTVDSVDQLPSPRVIRPHLPFSLLPPDLLDNSKVA